MPIIDFNIPVATPKAPKIIKLVATSPEQNIAPDVINATPLSIHAQFLKILGIKALIPFGFILRIEFAKAKPDGIKNPSPKSNGKDHANPEKIIKATPNKIAEPKKIKFGIWWILNAKNVFRFCSSVTFSSPSCDTKITPIFYVKK